MKKRIQDFDLGYYFLRPIIETSVRCHYGNVTFKGKKNLPAHGPYIIAPCHQSAMMDPLIVLMLTVKPVVFLCRSDIFEKPTARKILTFLKILPVYRIRDGREKLAKNEQIFETSQDVLLSNVPLCLMAEGTHSHHHRMLPLVKGMFRIAGETQKKLGDIPLKIVPIGLDYEEFERPFSDLVVNIGEPIEVQPFMDAYNENEAIGLNQMRDSLTHGLHNQMLDIQDKEHYEEILYACDIANRAMRKAKHLRNNNFGRYASRKAISETLTEGCPEALDYDQLCQSMKLRRKVAADSWSLGKLLFCTLLTIAVIVAAIMMPTIGKVVLFLLASYPILWIPTHFIPERIIKDTQFRSSIDYAIRFGLSLIYLPLFCILWWCACGWLVGIAAFAASIFTAWYGGRLVNYLKLLGNQWHYQWCRLTQKASINKLQKLQQEVIKKCNIQ